MRAFRSTIFAVLVALALALVLGVFAQPLLQNGDSAVYNDQVEARNLGSRTTHIGYIALGIVFRALLPGPTDRVMNWMTIALGVVGLLAVFHSARRLTASTLASAAAALGLLCVPAYAKGMLLSEVDVPLAAAVSVAFCLLLHRRTALAGVLFGGAMLISPLAALTLPAMLLAPFVRSSSAESDAFSESTTWRVRARALLIFGLSSLAVYLPVVLLHYQDYIYGGRGILHAPRAPFRLAAHARRSLHFVSSQQGVLGLLWLLGGALAIRRGAYALVLGGLATAGVSLVFGERFDDVPVQLSTTALMAPWLAFVLIEGTLPLRLSLGGVTVAALAWRGFVTEDSVRDEMAARERERSLYLAIKDFPAAPPLLVGLPSTMAAQKVERIVFGNAYSDQSLTERQFRRHCRRIARAPERHTIWFMRHELSDACKELRDRYRSASRSIGGRRFAILLPRE